LVIGLVSSGHRPPDKAAKAFLGAHGSRVFETPPRSVLNELTYAAALARLRENEGRGLSAQSYALREKIFEVDACVESDPRIREVHPEISFTALAESPLRPKKTPSGFDQRARLLRKSGIWLSPDAFELKGVGADDVLDAGAAAWSARRIANGAARSLPTALEVDERDRPAAVRSAVPAIRPA